VQESYTAARAPAAAIARQRELRVAWRQALLKRNRTARIAALRNGDTPVRQLAARAETRLVFSGNDCRVRTVPKFGILIAD
jgi:hypothetical protein